MLKAVLDRIKDALSLGNGSGRPRLKALVSVFVAVFAFLAIVGVYWSFPPSSFDVADNAAEYTARQQQTIVTGSVTTATLLTVASSLLEKPGGYISNDRMPPGLWLDNIANWEFGVLVQIRDQSR